MLENEIAARYRANNKFNMKSLLVILVLKILSEKVDENHYGQKIIEELDKRLEVYKPSPGIIYPILNALETDGYVIGQWDDLTKKSIKRYRITDSGIYKLKLLSVEYEGKLRQELILLNNILKNINQIK